MIEEMIAANLTNGAEEAIATPGEVFFIFILTFLFVAFVTLLIHICIKWNTGGSILNIIRGDDWEPSLSLFQFFAWTLVVATVYFGIYLIRIKNGDFAPPVENFPVNLLVLMGISTAVPVISSSITKEKYGSQISKKRPEPLPKWGTMLQQNGKITLSRFQMFIWTLISVFIYLMVVSGTVAEAIFVTKNIASLTLPDIDPVLVALMGLSQTGFLGGKFITEEKSKKEELKRAESAKKPDQKLPAELREFLVQSHDADTQKKIQMAVDEAEIKECFRYYIIGDDFYYLIENGKVLGAKPKDISRAEIMNKINLEKEKIGPAEIFRIE